MNLSAFRNQIFIYGLPISIIAFCIFFALSSQIIKHPELAIGITYDLSIIAPLLYFLLIRKRDIPKWTVLPFSIIGMIIAHILLPDHLKYHLNLLTKYLIPTLELVITILFGYKIYSSVKIFRKNSTQHLDFYTLIKQTLFPIIKPTILAKIFTFELAIFYYAFVIWKKPASPGQKFTCYKESGITAVFISVIGLCAIEVLVIHLLLSRWNNTVAWIITASSIYVVLQLIAHLKALRYRLTEITSTELILKYGLFGEMTIPLIQISKAEIENNNLDVADLEVQKLALIKDMESQNIAIYLKEPLLLEKAYGYMKKCDIVHFYIDEKDKFIIELNQALALQ